MKIFGEYVQISPDKFDCVYYNRNKEMHITLTAKQKEFIDDIYLENASLHRENKELVETNVRIITKAKKLKDDVCRAYRSWLGD